MILKSMSNLIPVKLMLTKGDVAKIDQLVSDGKFASRADFGHKAVFLLLSAMDGTQEGLKSRASESGITKT